VAAAIDAGDRALARIGVALAKYLSNKRCPQMVYEAMECLGGAGYVEEGPMPLLYREAPLNSIWEGSGNVICLDVLRTIAREPETREALRAELEAARGLHPDYDAGLTEALSRWPALPPEAEARWFVERFATLFAASVLLRGETGPSAGAYVETRVAGRGGRTAGAWPGALDSRGILARADPHAWA
jgi:putative acyl-CoA dehydrogenase